MDYLSKNNSLKLFKRRLDISYDYLKWLFARAPLRAKALTWNLFGQHFYSELSEDQLKNTRKSDKVFIFGSGFSINDISDSEWAAIAKHDTIGFNEFFRCEKTPVDYHLVAEIWDIFECSKFLNSNPRYKNTIFVTQKGWPAFNANLMVGKRLLPKGARVFRFKRRARGVYENPSQKFSRGIAHGFGSIIGATNFAYLMGWKEIVLVGVDLYDKRYFFLPSDYTRSWEEPGITYKSAFPHGDHQVEMLGKWNEIFNKEGVSLFTYNPKSLLNKVLPIYVKSGG